MSRLGTWGTFDCPVGDEEIRKAFKWLQEKVEGIEGYVWVKQNSHEFGVYPSFEIDSPHWLNRRDDFYDDELTQEEEEQVERADKWIDAINAIEGEFSRLFHTK